MRKMISTRIFEEHYVDIFEHELGGWYTDPEMWPKDRSWKVFLDWFDYEIQTMVYDMIPDKPLEHED